MLQPVFQIKLRQILRRYDQQILRILLFCGLGEIERSGDDRGLVDDQDLVVGYGVFAVDVGGNAGVRQEGGRRISFGALALIQNGLDLYSPFMGSDQGLADL